MSFNSQKRENALVPNKDRKKSGFGMAAAAAAAAAVVAYSENATVGGGVSSGVSTPSSG